MTVRNAKTDDAEQIAKIYKYYVENTPVTFEYTPPDTMEFKKRIENTLKRYPYLAAEENGLVLGYAYAGTFKNRAAYDYSAEISIYVRHGYTKNKIGTALYTELENRLRNQNVKNLYSCITYPNAQSENFHAKMGYKKAAHFEKCGYKFGKWLDVIWMQKFIGAHDESPEPFVKNNIKDI